jgi:flagellar motor switch protein FliM
MTEDPTPDEDLEPGWGPGDRALDQTDIDTLFGDTGKPAPEQPKERRGLQALVGGALVGIDRLPTLNIIVDRLAQLLTASFRVFTADNADVNIDRVRAIRLKDFLDSVDLPAMIAVIRIEQWDGHCLVALDPRLIASAVDLLLGGRRNKPQLIEGRPCTALERTFVERLIRDVVAPDLKRAFEMVGDLDFVLERFESTPSYAAITKLSAAAIGFRADVAMENRGGHIDFLIPYATLDPVHDQLSQEYVGKKQGGDPAFRTHLQGTLPRTTMHLRAVVEQRRISAAEVLRWRLGTTLLLNRRLEEPIEILCEGLPVLFAHIAERDGRIALVVDERRLAEDWPGLALDEVAMPREAE